MRAKLLQLNDIFYTFYEPAGHITNTVNSLLNIFALHFQVLGEVNDFPVRIIVNSNYPKLFHIRSFFGYTILFANPVPNWF